ncbi:unnamed protein product [Cylicostephanus goldi]|uniref:Uncharacterized protein n=1 Tax=Cylicostephanus goldi TaxID=71465 RepID=A0A3P6UDM9_CYLGO|nr:unnamed protein product [Cylicostephanus goldi]
MGTLIRRVVYCSGAFKQEFELEKQGSASLKGSLVEFDFTLKHQQPVCIRVQTPCGEIGMFELNDMVSEHVFRPMQHGCGKGMWKIDVLEDAEKRLVILDIILLFIRIIWDLWG